MKRFTGRGLLAAAVFLLLFLSAGCSPAFNRETVTRIQAAVQAQASATQALATPEAPALPQEPTPVVGQPSVLKMDSRIEVPVGNILQWSAALVNLDGRPLPNKVLLIFLDGEQVRRIRTDENGKAIISLKGNLSVGAHHVRVDAVATTAYAAASAEAEVTVRAAELRLITVPPLPNVGFVFNGQHYHSNAEGVAVIQVEEAGAYPLEVLPVEPEPNAESVRVDFMRWEDNVFTPKRTVEIRGSETLYLGFSRSYPISLRFVDRHGVPVDSTRIMSVTLKSSTGTRYVVGPNGEEWRTANRIARLSTGLEATEVQYAVESVFVDGANVVNQNQQRFLVEGRAQWTVQLLLYAINVRAKDALFGFPVGEGINLRYPDGSTRFIAFDENNELVIDDLARGLYRLQVLGARGMAPETPVAVSRNQVVELKVLSALDMALAGGAGLIGALGLLLIGRPGPLLWLVGRRRTDAMRRRGWAAAAQGGEQEAWPGRRH